MKFNKKELLKIYCAMATQCDKGYEIGAVISDEFIQLMTKIGKELEK